MNGLGKINFTWKTPVFVILGFIAFIMLMKSFYFTDGTEYAIERHPDGVLEKVLKGGLHWKSPIGSSVERFDKAIKTTYVDDNDANPNTHGTMKRITFNDTYGGMVGGTFIYVINPKYLVELYETYGTQDNLIATGLKPTSKQLLAYTANQFSGENFMQGAQNEYQNRVEDQANNGLLVTKRLKVSTNKNSSDVGIDNPNPKKRAQKEEFIFVTEIQNDKDGKPLRKELAINTFGIKLAQVTIDDFKPDLKLREFIVRKQDQIAKRQDIIEKQENARQDIVLAEVEGDRDRTKTKQLALKEKEKAIIDASKKVELAEKQAELETVERNKVAALAIIDKKKDLQVSKANEAIQKANYRAAQYEGKAIKEVGLAEAVVTRAKQKAIDKDIYAMTMKRDNIKNLKDFKITMPKYQANVSGDGTSTPNDSLTTILTAVGIKNLDDLGTKK